MANDEARS